MKEHSRNPRMAHLPRLAARLDLSPGAGRMTILFTTVHQQALCAEMPNMKGIIDVATKIVRSTKTAVPCTPGECDDSELHTDVRWLRRLPEDTRVIDNCLSEPDKHFQGTALLQPVATFTCHPFQECAGVVSRASKIATQFHLNSSGAEDGILTLQLEARAHGQFWQLTHRG